MKIVKYLVLAVLLSSCQRNIPVPVPETAEQKMLRTKGVTCADLVQFEDGTTAPSCELILRYHEKAIEILRKYALFTDAELASIRLDNVNFLRKMPVDPATSILPPIGSVLPAISYTYKYGLNWAIPVTGTTTLGPCCRSDGRISYLIMYGSEESVFHEELHRISWQLGADWWTEIAHLTDNDPLKDKFDVDAWTDDEYKRNHLLIGDFFLWTRMPTR